jgi:hypothetical protein
MDTAKQYFAILMAKELTNCKSISSIVFAISAPPLQLTHFDKECEAQMLQAIKTIPSTCSQRIAELNQSGHNWMTMSGYLLPQNLSINCIMFKTSANCHINWYTEPKLNNLSKGCGSRILIHAQLAISKTTLIKT